MSLSDSLDVIEIVKRVETVSKGNAATLRLLAVTYSRAAYPTKEFSEVILAGLCV